jgi:molecular chaperone DnaK
MVGGSSEMRPIQELMHELFEKKNIKILYPDDKQWSAAMGAAMLETSSTRYRLSKAIGVILADEESSLFPIFEKNTVVPSDEKKLSFGVVEEAMDAKFIFADENKNVLRMINVPIKGFSTEAVRLEAKIDDDMIAYITLKSSHMSDSREKDVALNKLNYYYDLDEIQKPEPIRLATADKSDSICQYLGCINEAVREGYCSYHFKYEKYESD